MALLSLGHFPRSSPTKGLEVIFGYMPLVFKAKELALKTYLRIYKRFDRKWDGIGHRRQRGHLFASRPTMCPTYETDRIPAVYKWDNRPAINLHGGGGTPLLRVD